MRTILHANCKQFAGQVGTRARCAGACQRPESTAWIRVRRVAVTVEQCWHRVPGGTATSTLGTLARPAGARRRRPGRRGRPPRRAGRRPPFAPPIPVGHLPLPRLALYETWHALRWPAVERATGPVDVVHATAIAVPADQGAAGHDHPRPRLPRRPTAGHPPRQPVLPPGHRAGPPPRRPGAGARRRRPPPSAATPASTRTASALVPWGVDARRRSSRRRSRRRGPRRATASTGPTCCSWAPSSPARTSAASWRRPWSLLGRPRRRRPRARRARRLERGHRRRAGATSSGTGIGVHRLGFLPPDELAAALRRGRRVLLPEPARGLRPAGPRGHGPRRAGGHLAGHGHRRGRRRRRACSSTRATTTPSPRPLGPLLDDPALADDLRGRGRARAATYTWARTAELTAAAYAEVAP